mmetsp:Transcript_2574/g.3511  ORF Transcript_2574/g.3511 Transcript_2574/m.3511 type:complete len:88 (-) Transcript_2574:523-786(-)
MYEIKKNLPLEEYFLKIKSGATRSQFSSSIKKKVGGNRSSLFISLWMKGFDRKPMTPAKRACVPHVLSTQLSHTCSSNFLSLFLSTA